MPHITIDGKECQYDGKKTILQVALENGFEIPHYCYHPGLSIAASCRICLAEIAQPDREGNLALVPKLVPTCQTPAVEGAEVYMQSPKTTGNQKAVMELLLVNHPLDCPVCDQAGECSLQDYSYKYGRSESRFEEIKNKKPKKDIGANVLLYSDRCIMCARCVRFTEEVTGTKEIGIFGRGCAEQIDVAPERPLANELSACVTDICPVGALVDKDFLMKMRVWNLTKTPSIDGITASGDNLSVEINEDEVYRIKPRTNEDVNQWWTSDEIRYGWKFIHADNRLTAPRISGQPVEWADVYEVATQAIKSTSQLTVVLSPMMPSEEAYVLATSLRQIQPDAILVLGPVPIKGEDKTFPGGYTVLAEKAPNARGVTRVLESIGGNQQSFEDFVASGGADLVLACGGYPTDDVWPEQALNTLSNGTLIVIDVLDGPLSQVADVTLAGCVWLEKAGSFENWKNRQQSFEQAVRPAEGTRTEGQIALDILALSGIAPRALYDAAATRETMGGVFVEEMHAPVPESERYFEASYTEL